MSKFALFFNAMIVTFLFCISLENAINRSQLNGLKSVLFQMLNSPSANNKTQEGWVSFGDFNKTVSVDREVTRQRIILLADGWRKKELSQRQINELFELITTWCSDTDAEDAPYDLSEFGLSWADFWKIYQSVERDFRQFFFYGKILNYGFC